MQMCYWQTRSVYSKLLKFEQSIFCPISPWLILLFPSSISGELRPCLLLFQLHITSMEVFLSNFYFSLNDSTSKTEKCFLYSNICIFGFLSFFPCQPLLQRLIKKNLKFYDFTNSLNKSLITFCLISWERNKVWHWNSIHW